MEFYTLQILLPLKRYLSLKVNRGDPWFDLCAPPVALSIRLIEGAAGAFSGAEGSIFLGHLLRCLDSNIT